MGLRQKLLDVLSRGSEPEVELDGDELVDLEVVPLHLGPITIEVLREAGIEGEALESYNAATAQSSTLIRVPRRQHAEATALLDSRR
jgi:hypothetical protein